jgi:hypothetical protein
LRKTIDETLQSYADRGVFRGFSAADRPRGLRRYQFLWLTRRPMTVTLEPHKRVLTFDAIFPDVEKVPGLAAALGRRVRGATAHGLPAHRRVDGRRVRLRSLVRKGAGSLRVEVRGQNGQYAVKRALGLVNDLFNHLQECYPDYLIAHFGLSAE